MEFGIVVKIEFNVFTRETGNKQPEIGAYKPILSKSVTESKMMIKYKPLSKGKWITLLNII